MPRRPTLIRAPALIYFAHHLDPALIQTGAYSSPRRLFREIRYSNYSLIRELVHLDITIGSNVKLFLLCESKQRKKSDYRFNYEPLDKLTGEYIQT